MRELEFAALNAVALWVLGLVSGAAMFYAGLIAFDFLTKFAFYYKKSRLYGYNIKESINISIQLIKNEKR
jgi:hypothetical protein